MDSVDKLMTAAAEHEMICVPVSLLIIAAACVIAAIRRSIGRDYEKSNQNDA